jgi:hypothetical protein
MNNETVRPNRPASDRLHPLIYLALVSAALAFALAVWTFAGDRYTDYILVIVTGFALIAVGLPMILSRVGQTSAGSKPRAHRSEPLREWIQGDFETWQDRVKGANAAVEILLPLSAIAIGMVAIGIVLHLTAHGGA